MALADFVGLAPVAAPGWLEEALTYGRVCRSCGDVGDALRRRATILAAAGDGAASGGMHVLRASAARPPEPLDEPGGCCRRLLARQRGRTRTGRGVCGLHV